MKTSILTNSEKSRAIKNPEKYSFNTLKTNKLDYLIRSSSFLDSQGNLLSEGFLLPLIKNTDYFDIMSLMRTNKKLRRILQKDRFQQIIKERRIEGLKDVQSWLRGLGEDYSLEQLENLDNLYLTHLDLPSLPESIGLLNKLKVLDLSYNNLEKLPESIVLLNNLKVLDLRYNNLKKLPESLMKLSKLKEIDLRNNDLDSNNDVNEVIAHFYINNIDVKLGNDYIYIPEPDEIEMYF